MVKSSVIPLSQSAYLSIRGAIVNLTIEPGSFLLDRDIAELVGASRTPVREALSRLEVEGWVESVPRKGFRVRPIDVGELPELGEMIACLEAASAIKHSRDKNAVLFSLLRDIGDQQALAVTEGDMKEFLRLDDLFHHCLLGEAAKHQLSGGIYAILVDQVHRARLIVPPNQEDQEHHLDEHRLIVLSMELGDYEAAALLSRSHRMRMVDRLTSSIVDIDLASGTGGPANSSNLRSRLGRRRSRGEGRPPSGGTPS